jgi:DNA-3-methyladenine glycosylase II
VAAFAEDFPGTRAEGPPRALRYAWAVDGDWRTVQVTVRQDDEAIHAELGDQPPAELARQAARDLERMLSLDVDGTDFAALGERDGVVRALQRRFPGRRPVLFYTPYEAAAWAIIGRRIRITQAATIKQRLRDELGKSRAFPAPAPLAQISAPQPGLTDRKLGHLRALATAAEDGALTRERLRARTHEAGLEHLQQLPGIGPFSAELILIRGAGNPDALPDHDTRLDDAIRSAYSTSDSAIHQITESWRPYRAWVALLLRAWREAEAGEIARGRRSTTRLQRPTQHDRRHPARPLLARSLSCVAGHERRAGEFCFGSHEPRCSSRSTVAAWATNQEPRRPLSVSQFSRLDLDDCERQVTAVPTHGFR